MGNTLVIDLDGKCNCHCLFCMKQEVLARAPGRSLTGTMHLIRQALAAGQAGVDFFGGEPTMYPFLKKAILFAQDNGLQCSLATNAIKFSSPRYALNFFQGLSLKGLRTTLHSHKAEVHDRITGVPGSWRKTVLGIRNILVYEQKLTVNIVINRWNYQDLAACTQAIYDLKVLGIKFSALQNAGGALAHRDLFVKDDEYGAYLLDALRLASRLGFYMIELERMPKDILSKARLAKVKFKSH
ncbi:MAG: radical SAM protein [Candidatus Omnitrophica bacterium]|nr:radical SAM protein [Candidatus Omnitrophota bacterium]